MSTLEEAHEILIKRSQEREREYGPMADSIERAAKIASELCNKEITPQDMFKCMVALKLSRIAHRVKRDSVVDACAYLAALEDYESD